MAFQIAATKDQKIALFRELEDALRHSQQDRSKYDKRRIAIYNAYRNRVKKKTEPWAGCSNTSLPILTRNIERMTIHTMQTVAPRGAFSTISALPVSSGQVPGLNQRAENVSDWLSFSFRNRMNMVSEWELFTRGFLMYGDAKAKVWWERKEVMTRKVERLPAFVRTMKDPSAFEDELDEDPDATPFEDVQVSVEESMDELVGSGVDMKVVDLPEDKDGNVVREYRYFDEREKRARVVTAFGYYEEETRDNVVLIKTRELVKNFARFDFIEMDDIYFSTETKSVKDCRRVWVRHRDMTLSKIKQRHRQGIFNCLSEEDLEDLSSRSHISKETGGNDVDLRAHTPLDREAPSVADQMDKTEGTRTDRSEPYEVWECFLTIDFDQDGEDEELVVWIERETKKVLRVAHLHEDYHSNDRPFVEARLIPVGNRPLGIGVGEIQMPLLVEMNTLFNNRGDSAAIMLNPGGFYRPGSGFYPNKIPWRPGSWIQVDNPQQDVAPYVTAANLRETTALEQFLLAMSEDLGVTTMTMGRQSSQPNAPRTARGTLALLQQDAIKLDYLLLRLMPSLEDTCKKVLYLQKVLGSEIDMFRTIGSDDLKAITKEDLEMEFDFYFELDSVSANAEVKRTFAAQAMQGALPIAQQPPEAVQPGVRILTRRFLESLDVKDAKAIIPDPPGFERPPQDQDDENELMMRGVGIDPVINDDHDGSIGKMDMFEITPEFNSMPVEWVKGIWNPHKEKHLQLKRAVDIQRQASAQGPGGAGGASNGAAGLGGVAGDALGPEAPGSTLTSGGGF